MKLYIRLIFLFALFSGVLVACEDEDTSERVSPVTVAFGSPRQEIFENVSPQRIPLTLSAPATQEIVVKVAVKSEDGVKEGVDYQLLNSEVRIAKGKIGGYVELAVKDCFQVMPDRTVVLELVEVSGARMADDVMTCKIIIVSNEGYPVLGFEETLKSIPEECGEYRVAVVLTRPRNKAVTFQVEAIDGTALQGIHYQLAQTNFTLPAGDTLGYVPVNITDDDDVNEDRKFVLRLKEVNEAALSGTKYDLDAVIVNDDRYVYASFKENGLKVYEDTGRIEIPVVLSGPAKKEVKVRLVVDATATAVEGNDYTLPEDMILTFPVGITEQKLVVEVKDNDLLDGDRHLVLAIDSVYNASIDEINTSYDLTIRNEDVDFVQLYDKLMGTYKLTYLSGENKTEKTCIISGGDDLAEENQNYLKVLKLNIDGMGALGKTARIAIHYNVNTGEMTIPMKQAVIVDASFNRVDKPAWNHVDMVLYMWSGGPKDGVVTLKWNKGYTECNWQLSLGEIVYALLCETGFPDKVVEGNVNDFSFKNARMIRAE